MRLKTHRSSPAHRLPKPQLNPVPPAARVTDACAGAKGVNQGKPDRAVTARAKQATDPGPAKANLVLLTFPKDASSQGLPPPRGKAADKRSGAC